VVREKRFYSVWGCRKTDLRKFTEDVNIPLMVTKKRTPFGLRLQGYCSPQLVVTQKCLRSAWEIDSKKVFKALDYSTQNTPTLFDL